MSRRYHKKSRNGCHECKKRHTRCDESRPICINCKAAELRCSFLGRDELYIQSTASTSESSRMGTSTNLPITTASPKSISCTVQGGPSINAQRLLDPFSINMTHLELYSNLFSQEFRSIEDPRQADTIPITFYLKHAKATPYLMHQVLATSAFHLSVNATAPRSRAFYHEHAMGLQSQAISLFHASHPVLELTPANCIATFLFSSAVGVHLLCDSLRCQRRSLEAFIESFTERLSVYRGVLAIVDQCRDLLRNTELGPGLDVSGSAFSQQPATTDAIQGHWDPAFRRSLNALPYTGNLASEEACRDAVRTLERIFNAQSEQPSNIPIRVPLVLSWPILLSTEFIELLRQKQAQALMILAHYAVLLHHGRQLWLIGDSGRFLIEAICASLDTPWRIYLDLPKKALADDPAA